MDENVCKAVTILAETYPTLVFLAILWFLSVCVVSMVFVTFPLQYFFVVPLLSHKTALLELQWSQNSVAFGGWQTTEGVFGKVV